MSEQERPRTGTDKLASAALEGGTVIQADVSYDPFPHTDDKERWTWRVRFEHQKDPSLSFGLDINDELIMGRGSDSENLFDLTDYKAEHMGVSRHHLMLRPTPTSLYAVDMGSTNGSFRNGQTLGPNNPSNLVNGDVLTLGKLQFQIRIIRRPVSTGVLSKKADLADALSSVAKTITTQLDVEEVLNQITETAMALTNAGETGIWLLDEKTGELYLEAERGIEDERIRRLRIPIDADTPAAEVIRNGQSLRVTRKPEGEKLKVKTDYLVEAFLFVPMSLAGVTFGVLATAHRDAGRTFSERDERLLSAIADFSAIAVHNARLYQATDRALSQRVDELQALNELSGTVSSSLDLKKVHIVLTQQVNKHWPLSSTRLWLLDQQEGVLNAFPEERKPDGTLRYPPVRLGEGAVGKAAATGLVTTAEDLAKGDSVELLDDETAKLKTQAEACAPLKLQNEVVGVLSLRSKAQSTFGQEDLERLMSFANPVATAVANARLFRDSEQSRAAMIATANALPEPLIFLNPQGEVLVTNQAAKEMLKDHMARVFEVISAHVGRTTEISIEDRTYIMTSEHQADVGTIVVMQDITYVKQLEKDRTAFVRTLSHDLKSPITSLKGWAQLIEQVNPLNEKGEKYLTQVVSSADRMLTMINRMVESVSIKDPSNEERIPVDLTKMAKRVMADVEGAAINKQIDLKFGTKGTAYAVLGQETQMYHMVLNLVDNAIKYSDSGGNVAVLLTFTDDDVKLEVADNGPGITAGEEEKIFDDYYRSKTTSSTAPGVGVGLSVVKLVAERHGGDVTAVSREAGGALFTVTLPGSLRSGPVA